jgi:DNA-binding NarL/FixJ family response regulator
MKPSSAVILQGNSEAAQCLKTLLQHPFRSVNVATSISDLRNFISKHRAEVVVIDIETASIIDVQQLCQEFPKLRVVCTHRIADEAMWMAVLEAGAADLCPSTDSRGILSAAVQNASIARSAAA